jgi:lipopolysaccharide export system permease protein
MKTPLQDKEAPVPAANGSNGSSTNGAGLNGLGVVPTDTDDRRSARRPLPAFGVMDVVWLLPRMLSRILFPKLLDRYVLGELLVPLLFGWSLFIILFVFSVNLFKIAQLAARGAQPDVLGEMLLLRIILASVYCLPMAMLLAGLLAFGRLSGDSELTAIQAVGIPNLRVIRNAFILGLVLSFAGLALNEYVLPPAGKRLQFLEDQVKSQVAGRVIEELTDNKAFILQDQEGGRLARVVIAKKFEPANPPYPALLRDVTYVQYEKGQVSTVIQADRAEWVGPDPDKTKRGAQLWRFVDGSMQMMAAVTKGQRWAGEFDSMEMRLNKSPQQVARDQKNADQMNYTELRNYLRDLRGQMAMGLIRKTERQKRAIRELEVELERKLAIPFAAVVLAMIGAPLGIRRSRSTTGVGIGLSLLIIILYYVGMSALGALGENGVVGAREAAWGCNVVGLLVGLFLTWRSSR